MGTYHESRFTLATLLKSLSVAALFVILHASWGSGVHAQAGADDSNLSSTPNATMIHEAKTMHFVNGSHVKMGADEEAPVSHHQLGKDDLRLNSSAGTSRVNCRQQGQFCSRSRWKRRWHCCSGLVCVFRRFIL